MSGTGRHETWHSATARRLRPATGGIELGRQFLDLGDERIVAQPFELRRISCNHPIDVLPVSQLQACGFAHHQRGAPFGRLACAHRGFEVGHLLESFGKAEVARPFVGAVLARHRDLGAHASAALGERHTGRGLLAPL